MLMLLYNQIVTGVKQKEKQVVLLIDPDKYTNDSLEKVIDTANQAGVSFFLIGGSLISTSINEKIAILKAFSRKPVFLFPGNLMQLSDNADGILFLSLISGRNAEYLIGNHVHAAPYLKKTNLEIIPTGYLLIDSGQKTSVEYISNTTPIPANKPDIASATALAGEMLGMKLIYLEGGSGAKNTVNHDLIADVKQNISVPLIVGGGINSSKKASDIFNAGADLIVIGNAAEENPAVLIDICHAALSCKTF